MTDKTHAQRIAELELRARLDRALASEIANERARDLLLDQLRHTLSGRSAIFGTIPIKQANDCEYESAYDSEREILAPLIAELKATPRGLDLMEILDQSAQAEEDDAAARDRARLAEIQAIENPAQRMNAARAAGLK